MSELWLPIPGFPNYEISDLGRARNLRSGIILATGRRASKGRNYIQYCLFKSGKATYAYAHTLVLEVFVGPRPVGKEARHKDGNSLNNKVSNLCWGYSL